MKSSMTCALFVCAGLAASVAHAQPVPPAAGGAFRGPSTLQDPYTLPSAAAPGVAIYSIASNGNGIAPTVDETFPSLDGIINRLTGIPDGMGGFYLTPADRAAGVITLLVNHEIGSTSGPVQAWGQRGSYVSQWKIRRADLGVNGVGASTHKVTLYTPNGTTGALAAGTWATYDAATPAPAAGAWGRFCSADLAEQSAYFATVNGVDYGTQKRIFMNGEEVGAAGRAAAHIVEDDETVELPSLADFSWENSVANPFAQIKTVVAGPDDSGPGQVYIYVGEKRPAGSNASTVEKAGLVGGKTYGIVIPNPPRNVAGTQAVEDNVTAMGGNGNGGSTNEGRVESKPFTMVDITAAQNDRNGNPLPAINMDNFSGANLQTRSDALNVFNMLRPEDVAWNPKSPNILYILTTNGIGSPSRLWELKFTDITQPELGGTLSILVDGQRVTGANSTVTAFNVAPVALPGGGSQAPATTIEMMDNFAVLPNGLMYIQEDVGSNARLGRTWEYDIARDSVREITVNDPNMFLAGAANFRTIDEEMSGAFDAADLLGRGWLFQCMQNHYNIADGVPVAGASLVQGGQLSAMFVPEAVRLCEADLAGPGQQPRPDGELTADDIIVYINAFFNNNIAVADLASAGQIRKPDGQLTADDIIVYINRFFANCG